MSYINSSGQEGEEYPPRETSKETSGDEWGTRVNSSGQEYLNRERSNLLTKQNMIKPHISATQHIR